MITDRLSNSHLYAPLHPRFAQSFEWLKQTEFAVNSDREALPVGRIELDGKDLYVMVQEYSTKLPEAGKWEAHRRYIDIQYILSGREIIRYANIDRLRAGDYLPERDFQALSGDGDSLVLSAGDFMILFPQDAHMPGMAVEAPVPVKKVVVKVAVE